MFTVLLRYRLRMWWRKLRGGRLAARLGAGVSAAAFLLISLSVVNMGYMLTANAQRTDAVRAANLLELPLFALFIFVALSGIGVALNELYVATDIELLLTAPLHPSLLFGLKLLDCAVPALPVACGSLCFVAGFAVASHQAPIFYLLALAVALGLTLGLTTFVLTLVLLAAQVFPARRMREAVLLISSLVGVAVAVLWALFIQRGQRGSGGSLVEGIPPPAGWVRWTPPGAAASALVHAAHGDVQAALFAAGRLTLFTCIFAVTAYFLFAGVFLETWSAVREIAPRQRRRRARRSHGRQFGVVLAIASKDWRTSLRDWPYLSTLLPSVFYGIAYPLILLRLGTGSGTAVQWRAMLPLVLTPVLVAAIPGLGAFGREGPAFGALRATPVSARGVLTAKFVAVALPVSLLTAAAGAAIPLLRGASALHIAVGAASGLLLGAGCAVIGVSVGAYRPNFDVTTNARPKVSSGGCMLYAALAAIFAGGCTALVAALVAAALGGLSHASIVAALAVTMVASACAAAALVGAVAVAHRRVRALLAPEA